jgi:hypothetical protein
VLLTIVSAGIGTRSDATQDDGANVDMRGHAGARLLEFVRPIYRQPLISESIVRGISYITPFSTEEQKKAAGEMASIVANTLAMEQQSRLQEQMIRIEILRSKGILQGPIPGFESMKRTSAMQAKAAEMRASIQLMERKMELQQASYEFARERRRKEEAYRLAMAQDVPLKNVEFRYGRFQNILLDSVKPLLLEYGQNLEGDDRYKEAFDLRLSRDDYDRIQLQLDVDGDPVIFSATQGSSELGKKPVLMRDPRLLEILDTFQQALTEPAVTGESMINDKVDRLKDILDRLDDTSLEVLGTAREAALQGAHQYMLWKQSEEYRRSLRGLVNQMELAGVADPRFLSNGKYDPSVDGDSILAFARFVVNHGCKIAPSARGDEEVYMRLQQALVRLERILKP